MANQAVYNTQILRYPYAAITDKTDYLQIDVLTYTREGRGLVNARGTFGQRAATPGQPINGRVSNVSDFFATIFLPMPSNIQDGNSVRYVDDSLNGMLASAVDPVMKVMGADFTKPDEAQKKVVEGMSELGRFVTSADARQALNRLLAAQAVNIFGGNVTPDQLLARQTGQIFNPNMELLFNGVNLRAFKFSFKMTPRNDKESKEVKQIIRLLKTKMAPKYADTTFLKTPDIFQLTYKKGNEQHPFLHKFKQCALTDMSVNYTGENVYATYTDATPVSMIMDLTFRELEPVYSEDYQDDGIGVGY